MVHTVLDSVAVSAAILLFVVMTCVPWFLDQDEPAPARLPSRR